jgi:hypothetical protein
MSDVTTGKGFDSEYLTHPPVWFGRVESSETFRDNIESSLFDNLLEIKGWGYRYKVRIFSWHTGDMNILSPDMCVMANVCLPVTAGSGMGGYGETPAIASGSIVRGFFMDGMGGQEPYIDAILGNTNNNVPKERGGADLTSNATPQVENIDNLTTAQLKRLLNPAKTPSKQEFAAATAAREASKLAGLSKEETERQVLIATLKASKPELTTPRQLKERQGTLGYQLYDSTFNNPNIAKIPDFRVLSQLNFGSNPGLTNFPIYTFDSLHIAPRKSNIMQDDDRRILRPLISPCKKKNSETKGIQRVIKNLLNEVEKIKKYAGEATAFAESIVGQVNSLIDKASGYITGFVNIIIGRVMGYVQQKISNGIKDVQGFLFPGEVPSLTSLLEKGLEKINCVFKKIIRGLFGLIGGLLKNMLDNMINGPLCAAESLISGILDNILGDISSALESALSPISKFVQGIGAKVSEISGNIFNAIDFVTGILEFFKCDEEKSCPDFNEINLAGPALPGGDPPAPVPGGPKSPSDGTDTTIGSSDRTSEGMSNGNAEGQPQSNIATSTAGEKTTSQLQIGESNTETRSLSQQERDLLKNSLDL